jgi:hypothetical protein
VAETPESIVQKQLDAYNAHDIDAFMATYSPTIQLIEFPSGTVLEADSDKMRADYLSYFTEDKPHVTIAKRIIRGNKIIDHEVGGDKTRPNWEAVAIYEVVDGLIQRVWFVKG